MHVTVYLSGHAMRDRHNTLHSFPRVLLTRTSDDDRVLAIVEAPPGSRVKNWDEVHGGDQLLVPRRPGLWGRLFGPRYAIPAKYLIQEAGNGVLGLRLLEYREPSTDPMARAVPASSPA
jgi:hypothetical protein